MIDTVQKDFDQGKVIVTYEKHGNRITQFADVFLQGMEELPELRSLSLSIQEPERGGINKTANVDLPPTGDSFVRVSGLNESWVTGKAESLRKSLSAYESSAATKYRKYGLNLNFLIFLVMLIFIPEIHGLGRRTIFVGSVYGFLIILAAIHARLIPNTTISKKDNPGNLLARGWPTILSWLMAVSAPLIASLIFLVADKELTPSLRFFSW